MTMKTDSVAGLKRTGSASGDRTNNRESHYHSGTVSVTDWTEFITL